MNPKKKKSRDGDDGIGNDRISRLPDEILCLILSFIPTNYSVATCVLSKRWEHLWKYIPKLNFDYSLMPSSQRARFADFVERVLSVHTSKTKVLEKFSLKCEQKHATKWIRSSVLKNIRSLDLNIDHGGGQPRFKLPSCIFTCKTLESLMLAGNILLIIPSQVCHLPKLRTLKLVRLNYHDDPLTLISLSPSLESLHMEQYGNFFINPNRQILSSTLRHIKLINIFARRTTMVPSNIFTLQSLEKLSLDGFFFTRTLPRICMPNLKLLELVDITYQDQQIFSSLISSCTSLESLNVENSMEAELNISSCTLKVIELKLICSSKTGHQKLVIDAPALKYLKLNVNVKGRMIDYRIEDLLSLEQAVVAVRSDEDISHDYCSSSLMNIYKGLHHVKSLKVEHYFSNMKGCCGFGHALPMFTRLTELDINILSCKCGVLQEFIINSTKLENLTLNGLCGFSWGNPYNVPPCFLTSLRNVTITDFRGTDAGATQMAKYLIENATILEKMEVCFASDSVCKDVGNKIISFCRASEKCVVYINQ